MNSSDQCLPGRLYLKAFARTDLPDSYVWLHPDQTLKPRWLCAVHRISRDARQQATLLIPSAQRLGYSILAPLFDDVRYGGYQRLERSPVGRDAGESLCRLLSQLCTGADARAKVDLFGFSAGAQFAHRFALVYPQRIRKLAVASAGWYTMPTRNCLFPRGLSMIDDPLGRRPNLDEFLSIPLLILVGDRDVERDGALRKRASLDRGQGRHRRARALAWHRDISRVHAAGGFDSPAPELLVMPGVAHSFADCVRLAQLDQRVFEFLGSRLGRS